MDSACASSSSPCASLSKKLSSNIWNFFDGIKIILENKKKKKKKQNVKFVANFLVVDQIRAQVI